MIFVMLGSLFYLLLGLRLSTWATLQCLRGGQPLALWQSGAITLFWLPSTVIYFTLTPFAMCAQRFLKGE